MKDLLATFVPKFTALAEGRILRGLEIATRRDRDAADSLVRDLHGIAGEAGLLGLTSIVALARVSEDLAKRARGTWSDDDTGALVASLTELKRALELVARTNQPDGGNG